MTPGPKAPEIPGYRIEAVLGQGATGIVYRARQLSVGRVVALKVLRRELVGARRAEQRLQREARATARLAHPNIISAIDMGEVDGVWWYAMELVDGVSLQDRLREGPLTEREALRMFIPLVEALQHAFERGVVHRDIKPGNILVDRDGRARLVDLGLAVADDDPLLTKSGGTLGTPHYISPEQARDPRSADAQSDLWSLGATLYHAVCGCPPFSGDSVAEILSAVLYARVPDPVGHAPYLSRGLSLVLRKCLTRDRARRYSTPAELLADLERVRERRPPKVSRAGLDPVDRDWRPALRIAGFAGLVAVGLAGVFGIAMLTGRSPQVSAEASPTPTLLARISRLEEAAGGPAAGLSAALGETLSLERSAELDESSRATLRRIRSGLEARIATEVGDFRRGVEAEITRRVAAQDFDGADGVATGALSHTLASRLGGTELPESVRSDFERWAAGLPRRVRDGRARAGEAIAAALDRHLTRTLLPQVDQLARSGDWRAARDLLTFSPRLRAAEAGVSVGGFTDEELARATEPARRRLDERRAALDAAWDDLDAELRTWVEARVEELRLGLEQRKIKDAEVALRDDWDAELRSRGLAVERMPIGVPRLASEALAKGAQELTDLERELAAADARLRLAEVEDDTAPLWKERRYGEIARAFEDVGKEPWSAELRPRIELAAREARLLEQLLRRAVAGVAARDGQTVTLPLGTMSFTGRLRAPADPLVQGFRMQPEGGRELAFALRGPAADAQLLPGGALESLAGLAVGDALEPADRLLLALFRWRDGDPDSPEAARASQAVLDAGPLPGQELLLAELERRILAALSRTGEPAGERRARAVEKLRLLRRDALEPGGRERKLDRVRSLLAFEDVLRPDELAEIRSLRDELVLEGTPSTLDDFAKAYGLPSDRIELPPGRPRVVLRFDFAAGASGTFEPGSWGADGAGWIAARFAQSDEEMLAGSGPSLALVDPLKPLADGLEVRLRFEQPLDSPPDLLVLSVAGFHVVLTGGGRARCLVGTRDVADAVSRARSGAGRPFGGLEPGRAHELRFFLSSAGRVQVDLDDRSLVESLHVLPRLDDRKLVLRLRSYEPVRLLSASVEGARR